MFRRSAEPVRGIATVGRRGGGVAACPAGPTASAGGATSRVSCNDHFPAGSVLGSVRGSVRGSVPGFRREGGG